MREFAVKYKLQFIIFLVAFGVYANTISHDYAWDDALVITGNERVQKGFEGIPSLFKNYKSDKVSDTYGYRPIVLTSFAIELGFFGLNPKISHFNNVLLYAILCLLVYKVLLLIFTSEKWKFCFLVALLFAVHPIHTEVVANIKSRDEILSFIFGLLAIQFFLKHLKSTPNYFKLSISLFFILLSFLCKESALMFIPLIFLIAIYKFEFSLKSFLKTTLICIVFTITILLLWKFSVSSLILEDNSVELVYKGMYYEDGFLSNPVKQFDSKFRVIGEAFYLLGHYIKLYFIPNPLLHDYAFNQIPKVYGAHPLLVASIFSIISFFIYLFTTLKRKNSFKFGFLFFLISIFGYLHIVIPGKDLFAERFMFVPSLGLSIAVISVLLFVIKRSKKVIRPILLLAPVILWFCYLTFNRNMAWKNNKVLFETDIVYLKNNARANYNYATYLESKFENGIPLENEANLKQVIHLYSNCIRISDKSYQAYVKLGKLYMALGDSEKALVLFEELASINYKLSEPFFLLGKYYLSIENYPAAIEQFKISKQNGWAQTENYYQISVCYIKLGQLDNAINILKDGEKFNPQYFEYYDLLSDLSFFKKDTTDIVYYSNLALPFISSLEKRQKHQDRVNLLAKTLK